MQIKKQNLELDMEEQTGIPISLRIFQFVVIHTVKDFSVVIEAEVDFFLIPLLSL